ncbi:LysR family transcriptional regulator [Altererythrobacter indicus]|uniref:LysR family transcriptional regulator n=1 Tax=Altericroceibacterium indicum TaxID=374177 RepID=A0A845A8J5_9SPHN|nr:LysR family transcriptional regulator [Altericroceibacterium indicum]
MLFSSVTVAIATIARCGSFRKAADELNISEAPVSKQMKALETACGYLLFERKRGRSVEPSAQGNSILNVAKQTLSLQEKLQADLESAALPRRQNWSFALS